MINLNQAFLFIYLFFGFVLIGSHISAVLVWICGFTVTIWKPGWYACIWDRFDFKKHSKRFGKSIVLLMFSYNIETSEPTES